MNYEEAKQYITLLTGDGNSVIDWRVINDKKQSEIAKNMRGTLNQLYQTLVDYNNQGYGIFACINAMNGQGYELQNVEYIRTHVVDLDNELSSHAGFENAKQAGASFAVQTSANKYHVYFKVYPYTGNEFFTLQQRKLAQFYDGDKSIIDATRVMRVPGFNHMKGDAQPVQLIQLSNAVYTSDQIGQMLAHINITHHVSNRSPLGTEEMQAPSIEWLKAALDMIDPNELDRQEWLSFTAAIKQAGWNLTTEEELKQIWSNWCARYHENDQGVNDKLWNSIRDTEIGWRSIERRTPIKAYLDFGYSEPPKDMTTPRPIQQSTHQSDTTERFGEILSAEECSRYFKDCYFINRTGEIFSKTGRFMNSTKFNGIYGGKQFVITSTGKTTDEPWKAALRSTQWTVPKVDHVRFLPDHSTFDIIPDALGRKGLNTYIPAVIDAQPGDVSLWLDHVNRILPNPHDQKILLDYIAHCVKYPGWKIPWSPMLQSAEGIGKTVFFEVMQHALGDMYVYSPKAQELVSSGSTFNAWMRGKLLIVVNEIKIDERRELIEILKPMITDNRVEIQSKGVDQDMEDNPANWLFFSNYKDAIPISQNGRRYAIFYSCLQSKADIDAAGMGQEYFNRLWGWLRDQGGLQAITHWLLNYPIQRGDIPVRAPETTSHAEALRISRSPMEVAIAEAVQDGQPGFRGGYVSTISVIQRCKEAGIRTPNTRVVQNCLESMGYVHIGRANQSFFQENLKARAELYAVRSDMTVEAYAAAQGYE